MQQQTMWTLFPGMTWLAWRLACKALADITIPNWETLFTSAVIAVRDDAQ